MSTDVKNQPRDFSAILARSRTIYRPIAPVAYDCMTLIFVLDGSAIPLSEFGEKPVAVGEVVDLATTMMCGRELEGLITATTPYFDRNYLIDQVFR